LLGQRKLEAQITFENAYLDRRKGELIEKAYTSPNSPEN
jgi:hypothetical protein